MIKRKKSNTCIAVLKTKRGKLMMAGDRRASWDHQAQKMPRPKIQKREGLLLGGTGDGYLCTLIVDILSLPEYENIDTDSYMHHKFQTAIVRLLKSKNFCDNKGLHIPTDTEAEIIVGIQGKLYQVIISNEDSRNHGGIITIDELNTPYATGCGGLLAWGSLLTTQDLNLSDKERLKLALSVAAQVSTGCDGNVDIISE